MIDRFTKIILAIIAAALVTIVVQNAVGPTHADPGVQRVVICDVNRISFCASLGTRSNAAGGIVNYLLTGNN